MRSTSPTLDRADLARSVAANIRRECVRARVSQADLARRTGAGRSSSNRWVQEGVLDLHVLLRIAIAIPCPLKDLIVEAT
jgi:transcriptional regulator with XRE-family HTH domain